MRMKKGKSDEEEERIIFKRIVLKTVWKEEKLNEAKDEKNQCSEILPRREDKE